VILLLVTKKVNLFFSHIREVMDEL